MEETTTQPVARQQALEAVITRRFETACENTSVALLHRSSYLSESQRPIVCLLFVFPLILVYELGTIFTGTSGPRSGVDQWLQHFLLAMGFGQLILLPLLTTAIMVVWHHRIDDHWRIRFPVVSGMIFETIGLGLMLFWAASAFHLFHQSTLGIVSHGTPRIPIERWCANTTAMIGSGIYEELFFRLILLLPAIGCATRWIDARWGQWLAVVAISLLFAGLHYNFLNPAGAEFEYSSFCFRFVASIVFSVLFLYRGFGVAVGTHVVFDVLTQV